MRPSRRSKPGASCPAWSSTTRAIHGSWLNQAEIEISVVERGCLSRPVGDTTTLERRVKALEGERNARRATIDWQFTNRQARAKLKKLYPVVESNRAEHE